MWKYRIQWEVGGRYGREKKITDFVNKLQYDGTRSMVAPARYGVLSGGIIKRKNNDDK